MTIKRLLDNLQQSITAITNLFIPENIKSKLKTIANLILQSVKLTQSESIFWN
jgi:hypothetical protein